MSARTLAVITARGGSKGLPGKNIRPLAGKPLIAWTLQAASQAKRLDRVIVSTDDPDIATAARQWGGDVPFMRPPGLATDQTSSMEVLWHALASVGERFDYLVLLQPTSPLRVARDIDACLQVCVDGGAPACVSVCEVQKSPYWMVTLGQDSRLVPLLAEPVTASRRQALPPVYQFNGAVYAAQIDWLRAHGSFFSSETRAWVMDPLDSVDIDDQWDFERAERRLAERVTEPSALRVGV